MKVGRNDPCPCGSGKKFKKCCIDKLEHNMTPAATPSAPPAHSFGRDLFVGHSHDDNRRQAELSRVNPVSTEFQPLAGAMELGFKALQNGNEEKAAQIWLQGWAWLLHYVEDKEFSSLRAIDDAIRGELPEFVGNWVQDLEACLGNLAMHDETWANTRLNLIRDLKVTFPNTNRDVLFNMREAEAETLFILGQYDEADRFFAELVDDYPDNAWAYIGWGDMYSPAFFQDRWAKDTERAREIYERGLNPAVVVDRDEIQQRIALLAR